MLTVVLGLVLGAAVPAGAQDFRFEWEIVQSRKSPRLDVYIHNLTLRPVQNVQVLVERLDADGKAVSRSTIQVFGGVPAGDRAFFQVPGVQAGVQYRFSVLSYDLQPVGGGGG